jgi:hypothetical protein
MGACDCGCGGTNGCFKEKLRAWRDGGGLTVRYTYGKQAFHDTTIREQLKKSVAEAKSRGIDPQPAGSRWV